MPLQRCISWNAALCDIQSNRISVAPGVVWARSLIQGLNRIHRTSLIKPNGASDRASIMAAAVEAAKAHEVRTRATWSGSRSVDLTAAWQAAKASHLASMTQAKAHVGRRQDSSYCITLQPQRTGGEGTYVAPGDAPLPSLMRLPREHVHRGYADALQS